MGFCLQERCARDTAHRREVPVPVNNSGPTDGHMMQSKSKESLLLEFLLEIREETLLRSGKMHEQSLSTAEQTESSVLEVPTAVQAFFL